MNKNTNRKETKMLTLIVIFSAAAVVSAVSVESASAL